MGYKQPHCQHTVSKKYGTYDQTAINERFKIAVQEVNKTSIRQFAASLGVDSSNLGKFLRGDKPVPAELVVALSEVYGVSIDWLFTGRGGVFSHLVNPHAVKGKVEGKDEGKNPLEVHKASEVQTTYSNRPVNAIGRAVPVVQQRAYGGEPGGWQDLDPELQDEFVTLPGLRGDRRYLGVNVYGDSMSPSIEDGDLLICQEVLGPREVQDNDVYVFCIGAEGATVKRAMNRFEQGYILLKPDNHTYGSRRLFLSEIEQIWHVKMRITENLGGNTGTIERLNEIEKTVIDLQEAFRKMQNGPNTR